MFLDEGIKDVRGDGSWDPSVPHNEERRKEEKKMSPLSFSKTPQTQDVKCKNLREDERIYSINRLFFLWSCDVFTGLRHLFLCVLGQFLACFFPCNITEFHPELYFSI